MGLSNNITTVTATGAIITLRFESDGEYGQDKAGISFHLDWTGITGTGNIELLEGNFIDPDKAVPALKEDETAVVAIVGAASGQEKLNSLIGDTSVYYWLRIPAALDVGTITIATNVSGLVGIVES